MSDPLADVRVSHTAWKRRRQYLAPDQPCDALRTETGHVCRQSSPNHGGPYDPDRTLFDGMLADHPLDAVFVVESDRVVVVTQTSQHADIVRGQFHETVGDTTRDAVRASEAAAEALVE